MRGWGIASMTEDDKRRALEMRATMVLTKYRPGHKHEQKLKPMAFAEIARRLNRPPHVIQTFFRHQKPEYLEKRRKRDAQQREIYRSQRQAVRPETINVPDEVWRERERYLSELSVMSDQQILMGEPAPCRSALGASPLNPQTPSHGEVPFQ